MTFEHTYRASVYAMLFFAALVVSIDATGDVPFAMLYPMAVAAAGALASVTVDRGHGSGLPRGLANALGIGSISLLFLEYRVFEDLLLALAHWLVYLQLIKIFLPKTIEDDWFLFLLGVVQVLVGTVMSQSDRVGAALFGWALSALWVLGLFYLHREARRCQAEPGMAAAPASRSATPYPGLFDGPFLMASLRVVAVTLALGGIIFLVMPRRIGGGGPGRRTGDVPRHLTGFDQDVRLGQIGEILEDNSVAMSVEILDGDWKRTRPRGEPLWRGAGMVDYRRGRWSRDRTQAFDLDGEMEPDLEPGEVIRQRIKLEAVDTPALFALRPILDAKTPDGRNSPAFNPSDGTLFRTRRRPGPYDYDVVSLADPTAPQPLERIPDPTRQGRLLEVPEPLKSRLRAIAGPIVAEIDPADPGARAGALAAYLLDPDRFGYSLQMNVVDSSLDPIEDFLVNGRQGHCAYFASALTLLLRSIDVPARLINGFKGGDWNDLTSVMTVRQKHAHSWVEALAGPGVGLDARKPAWITLDPTPSQGRDRVVAQVGGGWGSLRAAGDFARYVWIFYIVGFDHDRQDRLVYGPILRLVQLAREGYRTMALNLKAAIRRLLYFPDVASFFNVRGFVVSFLALLLLVGLVRASAWIGGRLIRRIRGPEDDDAGLSAGVAVFRRLAHLLAGIGVERPQAETPREFARRASLILAGRGAPAVDPLADLPGRVVDTFYDIRFGRREPDPEALRRLEGGLDDLEAHLHESGEAWRGGRPLRDHDFQN